MAEDLFLKIATEKDLLDGRSLADLKGVASGPQESPLRKAIDRGLIDQTQWLRTLENYFFCPSMDVQNVAPEPQALQLLTKKSALRYSALPVKLQNGALVIVISRPDDLDLVQNLKALIKRPLELRVGIDADILEWVEYHYSDVAAGSDPLGVELREPAPPPPPPVVEPPERNVSFEKLEKRNFTEEQAIPQLVEKLFLDSMNAGATDIHIEPTKTDLTVRLRVDGVMQHACTFPASIAAHTISCIKVMSGMDISEKRAPQDGRCTIEAEDLSADCRVSTLPSRYGEKVVIRILRKDFSLLDVNKISMPAPLLQRWKEQTALPLGMFLVTGPTGSGKTTTLYATLASLDRKTTNIITLEDPIEYEMDGITQVQINIKAGMTFEAGLRSILRQDPDTVLVGEIRDSATVEIAARAALTGHKMLSTLHTNDAATALTRLLDMGVAPFLLVAALKAVLAQRLVRVLCDECKQPYEPPPHELEQLGYPKIEHLYNPRGCSECRGTGYSGRQGVFELLVVDEGMHKLITDGSSALTIRRHAREMGMVTLGEVTRSLVISGKTSMVEAERAVFSEESREQVCPSCEKVVNIEFSACPFCSHSLKETCGSCGAAVEESWSACAQCGVDLVRDSHKTSCASCMASLEPGWPSCPYCGTEC